jgi:hypothetical protein
VRKKESGIVLPSVGETRQSPLELSYCGTESWWNGDTEICSVLLAN